MDIQAHSVVVSCCNYGQLWPGIVVKLAIRAQSEYQETTLLPCLEELPVLISIVLETAAAQSRGLLPARTRPQGGGGGALQTPKWLYGTMAFVGARGAGDFVLGIRQGEIFFV